MGKLFDELAKEPKRKYPRIPLDKEKNLKELIEEYKYGNYEDEILRAIDITEGRKRMILYKGNKDETYLEVAKLIKFLRRCSNSNDPKIKLQGFTDSVLISNPLFIEHLENWVTSFLETYRGGLYQFDFDWKPKEVIKYEGKFQQHIGSNGFYKKPYSDEELKSIIKYEEEIIKKEMKASSISARRGEQVNLLYSLLCSEKVFLSNVNKLEDGRKKGTAREYAFLYDYLRIMSNDIDELFSNKEKHDKVKGWIKAYKGVVNKESD